MIYFAMIGLNSTVYFADIFYVSTSMEYERLSRNCDNLQGNSPPDFRPMVNTSPYLTTSPAVSSSSVTANVDDIPLPTDVMFHLNKDMEEIQSESKNRLPDERVLDAGILSSDLGADSSNQGLEEASGVKASDKDGGVRVLKLHPDPRQILKLGVISNPTTSDSSTAIVKELRSTVSSVNDTVFFQNIFYASVNSTAPVGSHICIVSLTPHYTCARISPLNFVSGMEHTGVYLECIWIGNGATEEEERRRLGKPFTAVHLFSLKAFTIVVYITEWMEAQIDFPNTLRHYPGGTEHSHSFKPPSLSSSHSHLI